MIGGKWRNPLDVMVWPDAGRLTSVIIDQTGLLHGFSGTDCLSYDNAHRDEARSLNASPVSVSKPKSYRWNVGGVANTIEQASDT